MTAMCGGRSSKKSWNMKGKSQMILGTISFGLIKKKKIVVGTYLPKTLVTGLRLLSLRNVYTYVSFSFVRTFYNPNIKCTYVL